MTSPLEAMEIPFDIKKLTKLIISKKWNLANEMLSSFTFPLKIALCESEFDYPYTGVWWSPISVNSVIIAFNKNLPKKRYYFFVTRLVSSIGLIKSFHFSNYFLNRSIYLNLDDSADAPGLAFCSNRADSVLIPDPDYLQSYGYISLRNHYAKHSMSWADRSDKVFWRGSTTGIREGDSCFDLPRVRLCQLANLHPNDKYFDVGISSFAQLSAQEASALNAAGYARSYVPIVGSNQFKFQIDIDGNTNAWSGFFLKLLSGSTVLKVESPFGFKQWYYDKLIPGVHYVSVKSDMSDLFEKVDWLLKHDDEAREIGVCGAEFISQLNYDRELMHGCRLINEALN